MILRWDDDGAGGEVIVADREMLAQLYGVSEHTVYRRCTVLRYEPSGKGTARGSGRALYAALAAGEALAPVQPRARRLALEVQRRMERRYLT